MVDRVTMTPAAADWIHRLKISVPRKTDTGPTPTSFTGVVPERGSGFSLEAPADGHFLTRSRVFTNEEVNEEVSELEKIKSLNRANCS